MGFRTVEAQDWRAELSGLQEWAEQDQAAIQVREAFKNEISSFSNSGLLVLKSSESITDAIVKLADEDSEFALIQDSPDTIRGLIEREVVLETVSSEQVDVRQLTVAHLMDRRICIEPDSATVLEVVSRMTNGACSCTLIVDRLGRPQFIVSCRSMFFALRDLCAGVKDDSQQPERVVA